MIHSDNFSACFVNSTDDPLEEKHICYYVKPNLSDYRGLDIDLVEVYEAIYSHPEAPEFAKIALLRTRIIQTISRNDYRAGVLVLGEASEKALVHYVKSEGLEELLV